MFRTTLLVLWISLANALIAGAQETTAAASQNSAAAAKQQFDKALQQWQAVRGELNTAYKEKNNSGDPDGALAQTISEKRQESDDLLDHIISTGLKVYQEDPQGYPRVNEILVRLAGHFVTGDRRGDGGDQYEKALPVIRKLLEAGAGENEKWTDLWVWGGASAYCLSKYDLAEKYLTEASERGLFEDLSRQKASNPAIIVRQNAFGWLQEIPRIKLRWKKERAIRKREAAADDLPRVKLVTTKGEIVLELFENEAPQSVASFITSVKAGFYEDVVFDRVLPMFMAQGGNAESSGKEGLGYSIRDEHKLPRHRKHFRGSLSMAHKGEYVPNSGGSQFFLTFVPTSWLDGKHTVFGRVIDGMENAAALKRRDRDGVPPLPEPDRILSAEVLRDRGHEYTFDKLPRK